MSLRNHNKYFCPKMFQMKHIIVAFDGLNFSTSAAKYAAFHEYSANVQAMEEFGYDYNFSERKIYYSVV